VTSGKHPTDLIISDKTITGETRLVIFVCNGTLTKFPFSCSKHAQQSTIKFCVSYTCFLFSFRITLIIKQSISMQAQLFKIQWISFFLIYIDNEMLKISHLFIFCNNLVTKQNQTISPYKKQLYIEAMLHHQIRPLLL
jgi:hypothetical protein